MGHRPNTGSGVRFAEVIRMVKNNSVCRQIPALFLFFRGKLSGSGDVIVFEVARTMLCSLVNGVEEVRELGEGPLVEQCCLYFYQQHCFWLDVNSTLQQTVRERQGQLM